jgi:flagellar biosynthesis GTPase FlhF
MVKGLLAAPSGMPGPNAPVMYPQVNPVEAKRLEEALKRDLAEGAKRAEEERLRIEQQNAQLAAQRTAEDAARQEAERLRRQQTAALQNEADAAFRKQAEERQKQREKEEAERRAEEQRKAEAAQQATAEPVVRQEANNLRSGTVAWRGIVKGVDDVVIRGTSATLQHVMGGMPREPKGSFSAAMPEAPMSVRLVAASGPSPIRIIQQPSASNNFTTIVRVGEGDKADGKPHSFTLRWSTQ